MTLPLQQEIRLPGRPPSEQQSLPQSKSDRRGRGAASLRVDDAIHGDTASGGLTAEL